MKRCFTILTCVLTLSSYAQTENVISTGGNTVENSQGSLTWTIGESVVNTIESPDAHATQGFNQGWLNFLNIERYSENINITVFPNPTTHYINIESDKPSDLIIYDVSSKIVRNLSIEKEDKVDLNNLAPGIYFMDFTRKTNKIKTIKIIIQ
jgi:hypothetical protein